MEAEAILSQAIHEFIRSEHGKEPGKPHPAPREDPQWRKLRHVGSRLWLDTGDIDEAAKLWTADFSALTTNNTLLNKEVQKGIYDDLIRRAAAAIRQADPSVDDRTLVLEVAFVLNAFHGLRLVKTFNAFVSVELHTDLSNDVERTVRYGRRFYNICPERFFVKVPLTPAGYLGARRLSQLGIPVNFTLGFSARHNLVAALLSNPAYVNVFMGRLNAFVADNKLGDGRNVGEKATLATQRLMRAVRDAGRTRSLLIGASIRDASQVAALAGIDVFTMPPKVAAQYREEPADQIDSQVEANPDIPLAPGIAIRDFNGATLWDVPDEFMRSVEALVKDTPDPLSPDDLQAHFEKAGFPDFLPRWTPEQVRTAAADGKIPVYSKWKDPLRAGKIGLDALMNLSALMSFATDQKALDDRIASLKG